MTTSPQEMMGLPKPETVTIDARRWQAIRRQMIRVVLGWRYADKEIERILQACRHTDGCHAVTDRAAPCLATCPDRETFLSALVISHNAKQYALYQNSLPLRFEGEYRAPSREYFDQVITELETAREAGDLLDEIKKAVDGAPVKVPWQDEPTTRPELPTTRLVSSGDDDAEESGEHLAQPEEETP